MFESRNRDWWVLVLILLVLWAGLQMAQRCQPAPAYNAQYQPAYKPAPTAAPVWASQGYVAPAQSYVVPTLQPLRQLRPLPTLPGLPMLPSRPTGPRALCCDGTYSYSMQRSGTCSHHGGVCVWLR